MKFNVTNSVPSIDKNTGQQYVDNYGNLSWSLMTTDANGQVYSFLKRVKQGSPAPKIGDVLDGTVTTEMSKNGNSYTKFTPTPKEGGFGGGFTKKESDPASYIVSYAKDIVVALINNQDDKKKLTVDNIMDDLDTLAIHLMGLYTSLKDAKPQPAPVAPVRQVTVSASRSSDDEPPMPTDSEIDINSIPWDEK